MTDRKPLVMVEVEAICDPETGVCAWDGPIEPAGAPDQPEDPSEGQSSREGSAP